MRWFLIFGLPLLWPLLVLAQALTSNLPDAGIVDLGTDSFYDPGFNYSQFPGRVTDRNKDNNLFKIFSESDNVRFFKPGDKVTMWIGKRRKDQKASCEGFIRGTEKNYFIIFVPNIKTCWGHHHYFRRGTQMIFHSDTLAQRVLEASRFRLTLIARREDFLRQLNQVNNFLWSFDQIRLKSAAKYDREMLELEKEKDRELDLLILKKQDEIRLQKELTVQLDKLDRDLEHYRVSRPELLRDRWNEDHDLALPVGPRPPLFKKRTLEERRQRTQNPFQ